MVNKKYTRKQNISGGDPFTIAAIHHGLTLLIHSSYLFLQHARIYHILSNHITFIQSYDKFTKIGHQIEEYTDYFLTLIEEYNKFKILNPMNSQMNEDIEYGAIKKHIIKFVSEQGGKILNQFSGINLNFINEFIEESSEIVELFEPEEKEGEFNIDLSETKFMGFARLGETFIYKLIETIKKGIENIKKTNPIQEDESWFFRHELSAEEKIKYNFYINFYIKKILEILHRYNGSFITNPRYNKRNIINEDILLRDIEKDISNINNHGVLQSEIRKTVKLREGGKRRKKKRRSHKRNK